MRKFAFILALPLLLSLPSFAQDASQMETLSQEIHSQLDSLRRQSGSLTEQLLIAENELRMSSQQVETLGTELTGLNTCLQNTNEKLESYKQKLSGYETKLRQKAKWIAILALLDGLLSVVLFVVFVLELKGII